MELSPNDIRNYDFPGQMRGYDKNVVDDFVEKVAVALEMSKQENLKHSMELESLKSQLASLKQFEDSIKTAAIDARRNADKLLTEAKEEAEKIISSAKEELAKTIQANEDKLTDYKEKIHQLEVTKRSYIEKLKGLITSHLDIVEEIDMASFDVPVDIAEVDTSTPNIEVTDSSEVESKTRETVATKPQNETIKTEESNEPENITERSDETASSDEQPQEEASDDAGLDPELAAALESYKAAKMVKQENSTNEVPIVPQAPSTPKPNEVVETTALAEDIPPGFIAKDDGELVQNQSQEPNTDKIVTAPTNESIENNEPAGIDQDVLEENQTDLASSLDDVASQLDEAIEKAEKN